MISQFTDVWAFIKSTLWAENVRAEESFAMSPTFFAFFHQNIRNFYDEMKSKDESDESFRLNVIDASRGKCFTKLIPFYFAL